MKTLPLIALCLACLAAAPTKLTTLATTDGKTYTGVTITKVEPDGLRIMQLIMRTA